MYRFSTIHPAADSAWKYLKAESVPVRDTSDKVIIQDGRSDPAAHSFEEFRLADAGICLATRSEPDEATRETSLGRTCHPHGEHRSGVSEKGGAVPKDLLAVCWCQRGFGAAFSYTILRSSVLLIFASGCFGVVFVDLLSAQFHHDLLHLPATVKSLRVMYLYCPLDVLKATIRSPLS